MSRSNLSDKVRVFLFLLLFLSSLKVVEALTIAAKLTIPPPLNVSINIFIDDKLCSFPPKAYCPGETFNITTELKNTGTENVTGNLSISVFNPSGLLLKEETWKNIKVMVKESMNFSTNYTVQSSDKKGTYNVKSSFIFDGNYTERSCDFKVKEGIGTLKASPSEIKDEIRAGSSKEYNITLWLEEACNSTLALMNASADPLEVFFFPEKVFLSPTQSNRTVALISVSPSTPPRIYDEGNITVKADNQSLIIPLNITVTPIPKTTIPVEGGGGGPALGPKISLIPSMNLRLSTNTLSVVAGTEVSFLAYANNTGNKDLKGVRILIEGIPSSWFSINPSSADIEVGKTSIYSIKIKIPPKTRGVFNLRVKARNEVESNEEFLTLVVGENYKEVCSLLLQEIEKVKKEVNRALLIEECMDVTPLKVLYEDAELAFGNGKLEYQRENYEKAIEWFEYSLPQHKKVIDRADISIHMELAVSNKSKFLIPPFFDAEEQFNLAENYLKEKNYEKICEPIEKIRRYIMSGLIFWPVLSISILIVSVTAFLFHLKKVEREKVLRKIRERLGAQ